MLRRLLRDGVVIATALAAWSAAAPAVGTARADDAQVTVVGVDGEQHSLSLAALGGAADVVGRRYALRSAAGESSVTLSGFSPAALLEAAGVDPYSFSYLEIQRPTGGAVLLSRHQALDLGAFPDGPPVLYASAGGTGFLRPSGGPSDLNADDSFEAPQGIALVLRDGSPLRVRATASTLRTQPGRPVTFSAIVDRAGAGERVAYSWYFDDGASSAGARTRHRFRRRGSYDVVVGVTTPGDDAGSSAVVTIQVGPPLAGPDRKGGGRNRTVSAPDHGAASGADGPPAGAARGGSASTSPGDVAKQPPRFARPRKARSRPESATRLGGSRVSGRLLSATAAPAKKPVPAPAARTGRLEAASGGAGLPGAALGLLLTAGLLAAGAAIEARQ